MQNFKLLWKKAKLAEENVEQSELNILPIKPPYSRNDTILSDALDTPPIFSTKWETPLTENYEYLDSTKILQRVTNPPK